VGTFTWTTIGRYMAVRDRFFALRAVCRVSRVSCFTSFHLRTSLNASRERNPSFARCADVWPMGPSTLGLIQNYFPFSSDFAPVDLIMHVTASEVRSFVLVDSYHISQEV
jgi:hypothetical protein